jgi:parallel beta-helix repeat protein
MIKKSGEDMKRIVSGAMLTLLFLAMFSLLFDIKLVESEWTGAIYIRADGSIDPSDAPIQRFENLYALLNNVTGSLIVQRDSIFLDGCGYSIEGKGEEEGINLENRKNVTISNFMIKNFYIGIYLNESSDCTIIRNIIYGLGFDSNTKGIKLDYTSNTKVIENIAINTYWGVGLYFSQSNIIENNNLTQNNNAIGIGYSDNNSVNKNYVFNNTNGIFLMNSKGNIIESNEVTQCSENGLSISESSNNIIHSNDVKNVDTGVGLLNSTDNSIKLNRISNSVDGIFMSKSSIIVIESNEMVQCSEFGVLMSESSNNIIRANSIKDGKRGIYLELSSNNKICLNDVQNFSSFGIALNENSRDNIIYGNYIYECKVGAGISKSVNNIVYGNEIRYCEGGLVFSDSPNNKVFHNNFLMNNPQAVSDSPCTFDNGYPDGGNFWSDYIGLDEKSGLNQDQTGNDGIGDSSYRIESNNVDRYPLIKPIQRGLDTTRPTLLVNVTPSKPTIKDSVTFIIVAYDDPCGSGISTITLYVDDKPVQTWTDAGNYTYVGGPYSEGKYSYFVVAIDKAGNQKRYPITGYENFTVSAQFSLIEIIALMITVIAVVIVVSMFVIKKRHKKQLNM